MCKHVPNLVEFSFYSPTIRFTRNGHKLNDLTSGFRISTQFTLKLSLTNVEQCANQRLGCLGL